MPSEPPTTGPRDPAGDATGARSFALGPALGTYGTNVLNAVLQLGNVLIVSRALGPTGRGDVAFLTTVAGLSSQVALLGIHRAVANFVPRDRPAGRSLASNSLGLSLFLGGIAIGILALLFLLAPAAGAHEPLGRRWLALVSIPVIVFQACLVQLVRAYDDHRVANVAWAAAPVVTITGNGALALIGELTATAAVAIWVLGQTTATFILVLAVIGRHRGFGRPDRQMVRRMFGFGIKTHPAQVMLLGNYRLDQWILGVLKGPTQLGIYSVAVAWSEALFFLPTALQSVQRPDLVRGSPAYAAWRASRVCRVTLFFTAMLTAGMWIAAPFLCTDLFGTAFRDSVSQLRILTLGSFGIAALKLLGDALTSQRKPLLEMASISVAFICILTLDLTLIPAHGGIGAAVASAIAYSAGGVAVAIVFTRALPARPKDLWPRASDLAWMIGRVRARFASGTPISR